MIRELRAILAARRVMALVAFVSSAALAHTAAAAAQMPTTIGHEAYSGPHAHAAAKQHNYQVLALDTVLQPKPGASLGSLEAAMKGHVLASGDLVGLSDQDPQDPSARPAAQ